MSWARRALPFLVLAVGVVAAAILASPRGRDGPPLDPRSTGPLGTKALVDTLRELGVEVTVTDAVLGPQVDVALILSDLLSEPQRAGLQDWVERGGRLVVADPASTFAPAAVGRTQLAFFEPPVAKACDLEALRDVERVATPGGWVYEVTAPATGCFWRNGGSWLVAEPVGDGVVLALGGPSALVNDQLGDVDNALLAVALLAPDGEGEVAILRPPAPGAGRAGLIELIPPRVKVAFVQFGIAFLLVVAWRARRLGRPVPEPLPVRIPASALVVAVGNLLQQARGRRRSAALLRADLRRTLAERLGLPASTPTEVIVDAVAARTATRVDRETVRSALDAPDAPDAPDPMTEDDLVRLARDVETVRRSVLSEGARAGAQRLPEGEDDKGAARVASD